MTARSNTPRRDGRSAPPVSAGPDDVAISRRTAAGLVDRSVRQLVDVLTGRRPIDQVRAWTTRPVAGLLASMRHSDREARNSYRLVSVHPCLTSPSTIEASAVIAAPRATRALSLRLERTNADWFCTLLAFV